LKHALCEQSQSITISPNEANCSAKATPPASSSLWKRKFSNNNTSPDFKAAAAFSAS
jgi:hypothetical protein